MTAAIQQGSNQSHPIEEVLLSGNLKNLNPAERVIYHDRVCQSLGLNPLTRPFDYLDLNGKVVLYARKDATDQLRKLNAVDITAISRERTDDLFIVTVSAVDKTGRRDSSTGAVAVAGLKGEALANALMRAETKAKRRVTLSICGLGMLDETEMDFDPAITRVNMPRRLSGRASVPVEVDIETGEIYAWNGEDLKRVLAGRSLIMNDLSGVLGEPVTKDNFVALINAWLDANPGETLDALAAAAVDFHVGPSQKALT